MNTLKVVYFVFLMYLFLGISIIADLFMEAIEVITSTTERIEVWDKTGRKKFFVEQPVWNATIANLSLMALGSSAPEILLNVLETCQRLGKPAGELGPSTIVGSAAFNFLFITAVCIPAIGSEEMKDEDDNVILDEKTGEPQIHWPTKKIFDMGVFSTTGFFSIFAYLWLLYCLVGSSPGYVTGVEAWITLGFFFLLLVLAYGADKYNSYKVEKAKTAKEKDAELKM